MTKPLPFISITASLMLFSACDNKTAEEEAKPENTPEPRKEEVKHELADPSDVDKGLRSLNLTVSQNAKIKAWLAKEGGADDPLRVDPARFADYISSILNDDQKKAFRKLVQLPTDLEPGDNGDKPE